ncbi:MAG: hypothetical protein FWE48_04805 [Coriobacteriia bacterium]|nr:hypothetical protein [Coriobacteriia bacterium]
MEPTFVDNLYGLLAALPTCILPLLYIAAIIATSFLIGKQLRKGELSKPARGAAQTVLTVIAAIVITSMALFATFNWPTAYAPVDMSPLEHLSRKEILRIEYVIPMLEDDDFFFHFEVREFSGDSLDRWYTLGGGSQGSSITAHVDVYLSESGAVSVLRFWERLGQSRYYNCIGFDNNTGGRVERVGFNSSYIGFLDSERLLYSNIRIGNVTISMLERRQWNDIHNNYSSEFIELLVEMLQDDSLFEDSISRESYE